MRCVFLFQKIIRDEKFSEFTCLICARKTSAPVSYVMSRESRSCYHCGSTMRFRSIIGALSHQLYGKVIPLPNFPINKNLYGIGMSDANIYARPLRKKFSYTNTFYHKEPRLDIKSPPNGMLNRYDFVITSDVFEHIPYPVDVAFLNLNRLISENGFIVFSVPYQNEGNTIEHFKTLYDYKITSESGKKVLINKTRDGITERFSTLNFHGGWGETLEMRIFSKNSLLQHFVDAGFSNVYIFDESYPEYGIYNKSSDSLIFCLRR